MKKFLFLASIFLLFSSFQTNALFDFGKHSNGYKKLLKRKIWSKENKERQKKIKNGNQMLGKFKVPKYLSKAIIIIALVSCIGR